MKYISSVEKEKTEVLTRLKAQVDRKVDSRRKELHKEIDDACTKDLKELWAQKEYHETAITSMEGALSFARRALACKEDTELLALCAQVTSRLKELSQLKWDIHETEKIEIIAVTWTPANVSAGNVTRSAPTIDIEPVDMPDMPSTFKQGERVTFQVTTAFASTLKNFQPGEDHNVELSGSALCEGSRKITNCYGSVENRWFRENTAVQLTKSQNDWTINCSPPSGTTSISLTVTARRRFGQHYVTTPLMFYLRPELT